MSKESFEIKISTMFSHIATIRNVDTYHDVNGNGYTQISVVNEMHVMTFKNYFDDDRIYARINGHWAKIR